MKKSLNSSFRLTYSPIKNPTYNTDFTPTRNYELSLSIDYELSLEFYGSYTPITNADRKIDKFGLPNTTPDSIKC